MSFRIIYNLDGADLIHPLRGEKITVGRSSSNDLCIEHGSVSRTHAQLVKEKNQWRVFDMGSTNGTLLNDNENTNQPLQDGDVILFGSVRATFAAEGGARGDGLLVAGGADKAGETVFRSAVDFSHLVSHAGDSDTPSQVTQSDRLERLVKILSETSKAILSSKTLDDTFERILELIFEHLPVQRGFVMLWDEDEQDLVARCTRAKSGGGGPASKLQFSRTIAEKVLRENLAVLTRDAQVDDRFAGGQSIMALGFRSAMAAPLWDGSKVNGLICVDTTTHAQAFTEFDLDLLSALGNHLAVAVEREKLQSEALEKEKLVRELAVARDIQIGTFPKKVPDFRGYDLAGLSRPADQTGGDCYDLILAGENKLLILLGDATGHGIGPALSVTQFRSMLRVAMRLNANLDDAFVQINDQLADDLADNRYVTAFLGMLDSRENRIYYHSAGQGPIFSYHVATDETVWHGTNMMPMGVIEVIKLADRRVIEMGPGDLVAVVTDGVVEAENPGGEMFGEERMADLFRTHREAPLQDVANTLLAAVDTFTEGAPQADDITIVLARKADN